MKWTRAVHHLEALAQKCAEMATMPASIQPLRVVQLWAIGDILGEPRDLEWVHVALAVDLPVDTVPWLSEPFGSQHWANATRLSRNPIRPFWRSAHAPIWNHHIDRPALVWDSATGVAEQTLAAVREGRGDRVRSAGPAPDELRRRLEDELTICLRSLRDRTSAYESKRWSPAKIEPIADALWLASEGYLDILDALQKSPA